MSEQATKQIYVSQIDLIGVITKYLDRQGLKTLIPRQFNTIIRCCTEIVDEIGKPAVIAVPNSGLATWLQSDDTGMSSLFMAFKIAKGDVPFSAYAHPHDADDFGRCLRLVLACPDTRERIPAMAICSPEWKAVSDNWDELESLYNNDRKMCSKLIRKLIDKN